MAFKGDLKNISLFDVFQTLNTNNQTGVLVLQREAVTKKVFISPQGVRVFFTRSFRPLRLGEIFVQRGMISAQDVEILLLEQKQEYRPIGELLVATGKVSREEVDQVLRYHAEDEIYEVFSWDSGSFSFHDGQTASDHGSTPLSDVLLDASGLCLEAARRLDEMERLRTVIPTNAEYFAQVQGLEPDRAQNSNVILAVFDALAVARNVDELRDRVGLSLFDVLRTLVCLLEGDLIRPLDIGELLEAARLARDEGNTRRAADLLEKAHQLDPNDLTILTDCVAAVQAIGEPARLAGHLATLGRAMAAAGRHEEAIEHLEQALRHQPDHEGALTTLRDAFHQQGDPTSAAEISLRAARMYSEQGKLEDAVRACRGGLEIATDNIALRYYLGQILVRLDRTAEARDELLTLIRATEADRRIMRSARGYELLTSCYRLLIKINPEDEEAHEGVRRLDHERVATHRRRGMLMRGAIAAGILAIVGSIGLTLGRSSPDTLYERVLKAKERQDDAEFQEALAALLAAHPDSEEAQRAVALRKQVDQARQAEHQKRKEVEDRLRAELTVQWEGARDALTGDSNPLDAISQVEALLDRLGQPQASFLRPEFQVQVIFGLERCMESMAKRLDSDRQEVAATEQRLKGSTDATASTLEALEERLSNVRRASWPTLLPQLVVRLDSLAALPALAKAQESIVTFRNRVQGSLHAFDTLDAIYFTVKRERLRAEIVELEQNARSQGRQLESYCRFEAARELYNTAYEKASGVAEEEPRAYFLELLKWIESRRIREDMKLRRDAIDTILAQIELFRKAKEEGQPDVAFQIMRDLRKRFVVVQFEREFTLPYKIDSTPPGAEVRIDGELKGTTPLAVEFRMEPKPVTVQISRAGFDLSETRLEPIDPTLTGLLNVPLAKHAEWSREIAGGTEVRPVIHGGLVLVASTNTSLVAFRLEDGEIAWEATTKDLDRIKVAPIVCGDHASFITSDGHLYRVRLADGKGAGRLDLPGQVHFDPASDGTVLYVATREKHLVCVRGTAIEWIRPLRASPSTRVLLAHGRLYMGTAEGTILVHDVASGEETGVLKNPSGASFFGGIESCGNLILAGAEDGVLYAFDGKSGEPAWRHSTAGPITTAIVPGEKRFFLATRAGHVTSLDLDGEELDAAYELAGIAPDSPVLLDGFLYAIGGNRISVYDTIRERPWWEFNVEKGDGPRSIASGDGHIAVVTASPRLIVFRADAR